MCLRNCRCQVPPVLDSTALRTTNSSASLSRGPARPPAGGSTAPGWAPGSGPNAEGARWQLPLGHAAAGGFTRPNITFRPPPAIARAANSKLLTAANKEVKIRAVSARPLCALTTLGHGLDEAKWHEHLFLGKHTAIRVHVAACAQ